MVFCKLFKLPVCFYLVLECGDIAYFVILEMLVGGVLCYQRTEVSDTGKLLCIPSVLGYLTSIFLRV